MTIKLPHHSLEELGSLTLELVKNGLTFETVLEGDFWVITLTGEY